MTYLIVNHVPFARGPSRARFVVPAVHLADLRAASQAIAGVGGRLMVAAPFLAELAARGPSAEGANATEISPDAEGFEYAPLPHYVTMRQYLGARSALDEAMRRLLPAADVVQADYGGHPIMLAETAWPIAAALRKPRVFVFDANDPFPALEADARATANPVRRAARRKLAERRESFCRAAVADASLVFTYNEQTSLRFRAEWDERRCHTFVPPPMFGDDFVLTPTEMESHLRARADGRRTIRLLCLETGRAGDHALRTLAHCRRLSVPVSLTIMSDGPGLEALREMAGGLAMIDYVTFADPPPTEASAKLALAGHDVVLDIGDEDPPGRGVDLPLMRAMARGLALIAYDNPATARLLEQHEAARIVPRENVLLLAQAVIDVQQRRGRLIEGAEAAWRFAASRTLQATHRRRAELAAGLVACHTGG